MGRFSDAKPSGDSPSILMRALLYLIDLLDTGYSISTTIGGKKIEITINTKIGIEIQANGNKVFGVDTNGNLYATRVSCVTDPGAYAIMGNYPGVGSGLAIYDEEYQANPVFQLSTTLDGLGALAGIAMGDAHGTTRVGISNDGGIYFYRSDGNFAFYFENDGSFHVRNPAGTKSTIQVLPTYVEMKNPGANDHRLGVDNSGPYKVVSGVKTYL